MIESEFEALCWLKDVGRAGRQPERTWRSQLGTSPQSRCEVTVTRTAVGELTGKWMDLGHTLEGESEDRSSFSVSHFLFSKVTPVVV